MTILALLLWCGPFCLQTSLIWCYFEVLPSFQLRIYLPLHFWGFHDKARYPLCHNPSPLDVPSSPRGDTKVQVCADGSVDALTLSITNRPEATFYPDLLEGDLELALAPSASVTTSTEDAQATTSSRSCSGTGGRVAWSVSGLWSSQGSISTQERGDWTVFPSTGLLLPGEK